MSKPVIADNKPIKVSLTKGEEYYFCTCGRSNNQPFCDGSHAGTSFTPKAFVAEEDGGLLCKVGGFLTEHDTNERERRKWEEGCVSAPKNNDK